MTTVKKRKLKWFGHACRHSGAPANTILVGYVNGKGKQGRPRSKWIYNIKEWIRMSIMEARKRAENREEWKCKCPQHAATTRWVEELMMMIM